MIGVTPPVGSQVEITVSGCMRRCCGGGWRRQVGRTTYQGTLAWLGDEGGLILHYGDLGRITEVMVTPEELLNVTLWSVD